MIAISASVSALTYGYQTYFEVSISMYVAELVRCIYYKSCGQPLVYFCDVFLIFPLSLPLTFSLFFSLFLFSSSLSLSVFITFTLAYNNYV